MTFLAIIGLIFLLWLTAKFLNKIGNVLNKIGDALAEQSTFKTHTKGGPDAVDREKIREKIRTLNGEGTNDEYWEQVNNEIDDLTKE